MGIMDRLAPQGCLVIGAHERLPGVEGALISLRGALQIFERTIVCEH